MEVNIRNGAFKHVESELRFYHSTIKEIIKIRESILYRSTDPDTNIGGGKSNIPGDPTGRLGTALADSKDLKSMSDIVSAIDYVVQGLPEEKKRLVHLYYWTRPQTLTWDGIAQQLNCSKRTAQNWRREIVIAIALLLGWK